MKPYYYVYRYQNLAPVVRHATLELAQAEAERLAAKHPGETIEILKAVGLAAIRGPASTFFMDGEGPFRPPSLRPFVPPSSEPPSAYRLPPTANSLPFAPISSH